MIILKARVTCVFHTSMEVQVDVFSEEALTGDRQLTSRAFLTFVAIDEAGERVAVPPLVIETEAQAQVCRDAQARREQRLQRKAAAKAPSA
jgi:acyl-CoA hydrolase